MHDGITSFFSNTSDTIITLTSRLVFSLIVDEVLACLFVRSHKQSTIAYHYRYLYCAPLDKHALQCPKHDLLFKPTIQVTGIKNPNTGIKILYGKLSVRN